MAFASTFHSSPSSPYRHSEWLDHPTTIPMTTSFHYLTIDDKKVVAILGKTVRMVELYVPVGVVEPWSLLMILSILVHWKLVPTTTTTSWAVAREVLAAGVVPSCPMGADQPPQQQQQQQPPIAQPPTQETTGHRWWVLIESQQWSIIDNWYTSLSD